MTYRIRFIAFTIISIISLFMSSCTSPGIYGDGSGIREKTAIGTLMGASLGYIAGAEALDGATAEAAVAGALAGGFLGNYFGRQEAEEQYDEQVRYEILALKKQNDLLRKKMEESGGVGNAHTQSTFETVTTWDKDGNVLDRSTTETRKGSKRTATYDFNY